MWQIVSPDELRIMHAFLFRMRVDLEEVGDYHKQVKEAGNFFRILLYMLLLISYRFIPVFL